MATPSNTHGNLPARLTKTGELATALLLEHIDKQITLYESGNPSAKRLWSALRQQVAIGGKRLRPYFISLAYSAYGGNERGIYHIAAAWEIFHICLLIHDDIIDRDYMRHGHLNIAGLFSEHYDGLAQKEDVTHYANAAALLGGDLALATAYYLISDSGLSDKQRKQALDALTDNMYTVGVGELIDTEAAFVESEASDPETIAMLKTAFYSFVGPFTTGALLAGASSSEAEKLHKLGSLLGTGYQYKDDLLGVFGSIQKTGKPVDGDLKEGKKTILLQATWQNTNQEQQKILQGLIGKRDLSAEEAELIRNIMMSSGAKEVVEQQIAEIAEKARAYINELEIDAIYKEEFQWIANRALEREY